MGDQTVQLSKALSRLLRHAAIEEGVPITSDGWMKAADAIAHLNRGKKRFSEEMLGRVIEGNDKQLPWSKRLRCSNDGATKSNPDKFLQSTRFHISERRKHTKPHLESPNT